VDEAATESVAGDSKQAQRVDKSKAKPIVAADQPALIDQAAVEATPTPLAPDAVSQSIEAAATSLLPEAEISPKEGVPQIAPDAALPAAAKLQPGDEQDRSPAAGGLHASPATPADTPSTLPLEPQTPFASNDDGAHERSRKERPPASDQAGKVEPPANGAVSTSQIVTDVATVPEPTSKATQPVERHGAEAMQQRDVPPGQDSFTPTSARLEGDTTLAVPRSLAIQLGHRTAALKSPTGTHPANEADQARLVQRVVRAFQSLADGGGQVRLRLSPPELGALRLEITVREGVLAAQVQAETPQARTLLLESLPGLRERLAEQNIKIERFEVDLMNQPQGGLPNPFAGDGEQGDREARSDSNVRRGAPQSAEAAVQPPIRQQGEWSELNVVV
jgi:flagellar hook-length control protein FliK